jgi:predicted small secreted protein
MIRNATLIALLLATSTLTTACFTVQHRYAGEKILTNGGGLERPTRVVRHFEAHDRQFYWLHGGVPTGQPLNALQMAADQAGPHPGVVNLAVKDGQDLADILITHVPCLLSMLCGSWSAWAEGDVVEYTGASGVLGRGNPPASLER